MDSPRERHHAASASLENGDAQTASTARADRDLGAPMLMLLRQLVALALLPFTVTVLVPWWVARRTGRVWVPAAGSVEIAVLTVGVAIAALGVALFTWCLALFWMRGRGTLAPWDPPKAFVVSGPYRHVRNPMISGVLLILAGEACVLRSPAHLQWALTFAALNAVYIPLTEEPMLRARFGEAYRAYCRAVPRFVPRLTPWRDGSQ